MMIADDGNAHDTDTRYPHHVNDIHHHNDNIEYHGHRIPIWFLMVFNCTNDVIKMVKP